MTYETARLIAEKTFPVIADRKYWEHPNIVLVGTLRNGAAICEVLLRTDRQVVERLHDQLCDVVAGLLVAATSPSKE